MILGRLKDPHTRDVRAGLIKCEIAEDVMSIKPEDRERGFDEKIVAVLRTLRKVNDKVSRLALADLLEEQCPSITEKTTVPLRNGKMPLDDLTMQALQLLAPLTNDRTLDPTRDLIVSTYFLTTRADRPILVDPDEFVQLWQAIWRYRRKIAIRYGRAIEPGKSILEEAKAVHELVVEECLR